MILKADESFFTGIFSKWKNNSTFETKLSDRRMKAISTSDLKQQLQQLFTRRFGMPIESIAPLPGAGSNRKYFRIMARNVSVIGSFNPDKKEHKVFLYLSSHFRTLGLNVPEVLASDPNEGICLLQDLGNETLLEWIENNRSHPDFSSKLSGYYKQVLLDLIRFQFDGGKELDYRNLLHPAFDSQSMHWDLNYFKYYFLKPARISFDEKALEKDFETLVAYLAEEETHGFMYRDFQARNVMLHNEKLYYIDYQGGRKGPLQYDVVSLLFQVKAMIPDSLREELIDFYLMQLQSRTDVDSSVFRARLKAYVLLRLLQVMGAYGFRGWFERKPHFLESIPLLKANLNWLLQNLSLPVSLPELLRIISEIPTMMENNILVPVNKLNVSINSFSFRRGIPYDPSGHGGGFVFDCRLLPNPGRQQEYQQLTGKDDAVITYLENEPAVHLFVENVEKLVQQSVKSYLQAGYGSLQLNFGCTGGRHRSVYCAERVAATLRSQKNVTVILKHSEFQNSRLL
jgi:aminoglycoside/choline kinase family phosphotransferase